jgi:hypothetical protein
MENAELIRRLADEAILRPETIARFFGGLPVKAQTQRRIELAAQRLGLELPAISGQSEANRKPGTRGRVRLPKGA